MPNSGLLNSMVPPNFRLLFLNNLSGMLLLDTNFWRAYFYIADKKLFQDTAALKYYSRTIELNPTNHRLTKKTIRTSSLICLVIERVNLRYTVD